MPVLRVVTLVVLFYVAVFAVWLGRWAWFGTEALMDQRRARRVEETVPSAGHSASDTPFGE